MNQGHTASIPPNQNKQASSTMPDQSTCRCGAPPTAQRSNPNSQTESKCIPCAAIDRHQLAAQPERTVPLPPHLVASGAARIHPLDTVWNH